MTALLTTDQWNETADPQAMIRFLQSFHPIQERKARLLAIHCARRLWRELPAEGQKAIGLAEQYAERALDAERMDQGHETCYESLYRSWAWVCGFFGDPELDFMQPNPWLIDWDRGSAPLILAYIATSREVGQFAEALVGWSELLGIETELLSILIRDLIRPDWSPLFVSSQWKQWNQGAIPAFAQYLYDSRQFKDMPILADALEDAGCDNEEILSHCRRGGWHYRGCWVLDLLLEKG